jgi:hypothetical protein
MYSVFRIDARDIHFLNKILSAGMIHNELSFSVGKLVMPLVKQYLQMPLY